jgi:hypothetical protein
LEQLVEWRLAGETEVLGENLPQRHFVHHKIPHDQTRARTPDRSGGKPATNRLSYDAETRSSSETPVNFYRTTRRHITEDATLSSLVLCFVLILRGCL